MHESPDHVRIAVSRHALSPPHRLERGWWYRIRQGIKGFLVPDECGFAVAYMICEPSSHYYRVMMGNDRMPVLIEERI